MLTLLPRLDFGGQPFTPPVSSFDLPWLKSQFYPAQVSRRDRVIAAIQNGETRIADARKAASSNVPTFGERRQNGTIYRSSSDQALQAAAETVANRQTVDAIRKIREEIDGKVLVDLKDMERASLTARVLSERVFDLISCLSRANAGMSVTDLVAFKSDYKELICGISAIELHRMAQAAIDDGSPLSLVMLDCIRMENFNRKSADRPFLNASLLALITVPEYSAAVGSDSQPGLLRQVVNLHKQAGTTWAGFLGKIGQASVMRIARGLADLSLDSTSVPIDGE